MIIGRVSEKQKLLRAYNSEYSEFVTVYGRRRVGKTFFIRETFDYKFTFEHAGLANSGMKKQLSSWRSSLRDAGMSNVNKPKDWIGAFDMLKVLVQESHESKKVIFIDEMPWMDTLHSGFIQALEHFWNGWASGRKDILLIICGSATSWIINNLIKNHGGLHGRVTNKIHIEPFTLDECEQYSSKNKLGLNKRLVAEAFMVMGGIPYYWSFLDRTKSLSQNIDNLFFNKDGELYNEYDELYASLFRNPEPYQEVITVLGKKKAGMTRAEIVSNSKISDNGKLSSILNDLESCGFIRKYNALGYKEKHAVFQLMDPYTLFYFKFVINNRNNDEHFWSNNQNSAVYNSWCGLAFERVCFEHINQIKQALGILGVATNVCSWRFKNVKNGDEVQKGAQIDLVIDRADNVIDLCEIKFTKAKFEITNDYYEILNNKMERFLKDTKTKKAVHIVMVSAQGIVDNSYSNDIQNVIILDNLFAEAK